MAVYLSRFAGGNGSQFLAMINNNKKYYLTLIRRRRSEYCRIIPETKSMVSFIHLVHTLELWAIRCNKSGSRLETESPIYM